MEEEQFERIVAVLEQIEVVRRARQAASDESEKMRRPDQEKT